MTLIITRQLRRPSHYASDSQRSQASVKGRLAEGYVRKGFIIAPEVEKKAQILMKQYNVSFVDLIRSLILSA